MIIAFSAGEASGDMAGALLAEAVRKQRPDWTLIGVGGSRLRAAGVDIIEDSSDWGALGILESLRVYRKVSKAYYRLLRKLDEVKPDLIVPIDFGYFNIRLCRWAKQRQINVLYFMPPGSWRKDRQGKDLPSVADAIAAPFEWSADLLNKAGGNAAWVGHPILDSAKPALSEQAFRAELKLPNTAAVFGLLPGSRSHEIAHHVPLSAQTAEMMKASEPNLLFVTALAPHVSADAVDALWRKHSSVQMIPLAHRTYDVMAHSKALIVSSGTATLEAAVIGTPMVVVYKGSLIMRIEYFIAKPQFEYISLPNIILGKPLLPELIQNEASPQTVSQHLLRLMQEGDARNAQLDGFKQVREKLGAPGAVQRTADMLIKLAEKHKV